jgi:Holliday junction resolvasome RuvABC endonuclease subunit
MELPSSGSVRIGREDPGECFAAMRDWLFDTITANQIEHMVLESAFISMKTASSAPRLYGLAGIAREVAYRRRVRVTDASPNEWRRFFLGQAMAPKSVAAKHRRAWLKNETVTRCRNLGIDVKSDDEADAIGVLFFERARLFPQYGVEGELGLRIDPPF